MRILILLTTLCSLAIACRAAEPTYDLHEWGVFPVPRNVEWAMQDTRAELSGMPAFFCMVWPREKLPWFGPVRKPVIYLYPTQPLQVSLTIRFAEGRPLVWWPAASSPVGGVPNQTPNELQFDLRVGDVAPPGSSQRKRLDELAKSGQEIPDWDKKALKDTEPFEVAKGHWVEMLREVPSAKVYSSGGHSRLGYNGDLVEKFIYYDGLMKAPQTPQVAREGDALVVHSNFPYAVSDLMVIERDGTRTRIGKAWTNIVAGEQTTKLELVAAGDNRGDAKALTTLSEDFVAHLVAAGLTKEESIGLEKVWHEGLFLHAGLNLFYRVPRETYDAWLPLTAEPKPAKLVRVGIVLHEHLEPELEAIVATQIKKLSADDFEARQQALQALMHIGGAAFPQLEAAIKSKDTDLEAANGCRKVLEMLDARPGLDASKKR